MTFAAVVLWIKTFLASVPRAVYTHGLAFIVGVVLRGCLTVAPVLLLVGRVSAEPPRQTINGRVLEFSFAPNTRGYMQVRVDGEPNSKGSYAWHAVHDGHLSIVGKPTPREEVIYWLARQAQAFVTLTGHFGDYEVVDSADFGPAYTKEPPKPCPVNGSNCTCGCQQGGQCNCALTRVAPERLSRLDPQALAYRDLCEWAEKHPGWPVDVYVQQDPVPNRPYMADHYCRYDAGWPQIKTPTIIHAMYVDGLFQEVYRTPRAPAVQYRPVFQRFGGNCQGGS